MIFGRCAASSSDASDSNAPKLTDSAPTNTAIKSSLLICDEPSRPLPECRTAGLTVPNANATPQLPGASRRLKPCLAANCLQSPDTEGERSDDSVHESWRKMPASGTSWWCLVAVSWPPCFYTFSVRRNASRFPSTKTPSMRTETPDLTGAGYSVFCVREVSSQTAGVSSRSGSLVPGSSGASASGSSFRAGDWKNRSAIQ
jgi:hypothetical protein